MLEAINVNPDQLPAQALRQATTGPDAETSVDINNFNARR